MTSRRSIRGTAMRLCVELLERRVCLTWDPIIDPFGALVFRGTEEEDLLTDIRAIGGSIFYSDEVGGPILAPGAPAAITHIIVYAFGDDDTINVVDGAQDFPGAVTFSIFGHQGDDEIYGPPKTALGAGFNGHLLVGGTEEDIIEGGDGDDRIEGNEHNDIWISGGDGDDTIDGGSGNETDVYGGKGNDTIRGGEGDDVLWGEENVDHIYGGPGNDDIRGGPGTDWTFSNTDPLVPDQPYRGFPLFPGTLDMFGSGGADCDVEDGHPECIPEVFGDAYAATSGVPTIVAAPGILANDDPDGLGDCGCPFVEGEFTINVGAVSGGNFVLATNSLGQHTGGFTYTYTGPASEQTVEYSITNEHGTSYYPATITFTIPNSPPVAVPDSYNAGGNSSLQVVVEDPDQFPYGLLHNDSDANNDPVHVIIVDQPLYGVLFDDGGGAFTYAANNDNPGTDSFTYQLWDDFAFSDTVTVTITNIVPPGVLLLDQPPKTGGDAPSLSSEAAQRMLIAAGERWHEAGLSRSTLSAVLSGVTVVVVDLPGSALGALAGNVLMVDANAAGYGWFVDATPGNDSEFGRLVSASERRADAGSAAYGRADLLTVMMHELGHRMGMEHSDAPGNIMHDEIGLGTRRLPTVWDAALAELMYSSTRRRAS